MNTTTTQTTTSSSTPVSEFIAHTFNHPLAAQTFSSLNQAIRADSSPQVILLTGPTGVGKTTLVRAVCKQLLQECKAQLDSEPDFVPIVAMNAIPPTGANFDWKDFYIRLLSGQHEPLVDRKLYLPRQIQLLPEYPSANPLERSVTNALRRSMEEYLRRRRTKLLFVDEAHHILLAGNQRRLECQFETIKSFTIETGVTILLNGTYRLLDILDQSGQLTRRSQIVNFPRYDMRRKTDREEFRKVLLHLEHKLSAYVATRLDAHAEYFYQKSAGCVGILKDWLTRCLDHALKENKATIDASFAERFALKNRGLVTIVEEACWGEERLADVGDERIIDLLKNGVLLARDDNQRKPVSRRPGQRNPRRDPIGMVQS